MPSGTGTDISVTANPTINTSQTIGNVTILNSSNGIQITVNSPGNWQIGANGASKSMTINGNNAQIQIATGGKIEIWGDLIVANNLQLQVTGTLIIHGNLQMTNGAQLQVSGGGDIIIGGNFTGGANTQIQVSGSGSTIQVSGSLTLTGGSNSMQVSSGGQITAASCSCTGCGSSTGCSNVVLPVTIIFFDGHASESKVILQWATATEINFDYFQINRSNDGEHFEVIGTVKGHGTTLETHNYDYTDETPSIGKNYYSLTSVDFDDYRERFKVIRVDYQGKIATVVSPNPVRDGRLSLISNVQTEGQVSFAIMSSSGLLMQKGSASAAELAAGLDVKLPSGIYLLRLEMEGQITTTKFLVEQ